MGPGQIQIQDVQGHPPLSVDINLTNLFLQTMKVEFAIRSNVTFNGLHDDDSPIHGKAVTFRARDCLHIKAVRFELRILAGVFVMQLLLS